MISSWSAAVSTQKLLVCADDVTMSGDSTQTVQKNKVALSLASKETGFMRKRILWPCLEIRMQGKITAYRKIINTLKGWNS